MLVIHTKRDCGCSSGQFNLFDAAKLNVILLGIYHGARLFSTHGWKMGVTGGVLGLLGSLVFLKAWVAILDRIDRKFRKTRPICKNGCCGPSDYIFNPKNNNMTFSENGFLYTCRCGDQYFSTFDGNFMIVCPDGELVPYSKKKWVFGKWHFVKEEPPFSSDSMDDEMSVDSK
ncbi:MAG: hypothetical protein PWP23_234 [Candidatus Sumerlaeota bacterium]|nr:hypothetical protein [Candidatus Sumerlaeota bacterium]